MIWDAHAHYLNLNASTQLPTNLRKVFLTGSNPDDWDRLVSLQKTSRFLIPDAPDDFFEIAFGLHPWWIDEKACAGEELVLRKALALLPERLSACGAVALGELGLDYFKKRDSRFFYLQRELFDSQLTLAKELKLPLVLHVVQAHQDVLASLKGNSWKGIAHSFSGDSKTARKYLDFGLKLSLSPRWLLGKSDALTSVIQALPLESFVIESDSESENLTGVALELARLKNVTLETVWKMNHANLQEIFLHP